MFPKTVNLVEVGPRDGLQNEPLFVPTPLKIALVNALSNTGLRFIEAGSFVAPSAIPQLADSDEVFEKIRRVKNVSYSALVPNIQGYQRARNVKVEQIALFAAASDSFSQKNINCSIDESLKRFEQVAKQAKKDKVAIRAYLSCVIACPYEGTIKPQVVAGLAKKLIDLGANQISLGDTIGVGTPKNVKQLIDEVSLTIPREKIAMHFHDTYGQAIANVYASLESGINTFDSSIAGLGGCPYAKGATGNVATEDLLYLLQGLGINTGVDLTKVITAGNEISTQLGRPTNSKVARALS